MARLKGSLPISPSPASAQSSGASQPNNFRKIMASLRTQTECIPLATLSKVPWPSLEELFSYSKKTGISVQSLLENRGVNLDLEDGTSVVLDADCFIFELHPKPGVVCATEYPKYRHGTSHQ
jgi:hypothetical protein